MGDEKIWKKVLEPSEQVQFAFSIGKGYRIFGIVIWFVVSLPFFWLAGVGFLMFFLALFYYGFYLRVSNSYAFTNKRIIVHTGWLSTNMKSVDYAKITDIHVREPFFERIVAHTGSLAINTAGSGSMEIVLRHVEAPYELKKRLDSIRGQ